MSTATFLRGTRTDDVTVVDNPAPDLKEILGGYYLIEADDDEHARRIAERCPAPFGYIEVRPIWDIPGTDALTTRAAAAADAQRRYWGRVLAATLRMARDVDIAEEATADAFAARPADVARARRARLGRGVAADRRPAPGDRPHPPARPRFRERLAADRRHRRPGRAAGRRRASTRPPVLDDELRLVVLCCHPALAHEAQVALTMRLGCGVPTASIAAAFLVPEATMAARLTRAKKRIAGSGAGHRPARRRRRRGAHAGGAAHDPPRLHDGPHRRVGRGAPRRRRRRPRRAPGPAAARAASGRQRGRPACWRWCC